MKVHRVTATFDIETEKEEDAVAFVRHLVSQAYSEVAEQTLSPFTNDDGEEVEATLVDFMPREVE